VSSLKPWVCAKNVRIAGWLVCFCLALWISLHAQYRADMSAFLPVHPSANQKVLLDQLKDGAVSRLVLIGVDAQDSEQLAQISAKMLAELRSQKQWSLVSNGSLVGSERDIQFLIENRYLLTGTGDPQAWTTPSLQRALLEARAMLTSQAGFFAKDLVPRDPTGELLRLLEGLAAQNQTPMRHGVWMIPKVGKTGLSRALILAQTSAPSIDLDAQESAIRAVEQSFSGASGELSKVNGATLVMSGPGVFAAMSRERIKSEVTLLSGLATMLVIALIWWVYRSVPVMLLGLLPVVTGIVAGIAAVALSFGYVHGLTLGFGATLIGEAIDYAIYLLTLVRKNAEDGPHQIMPRIWPTLRTGVLTSIFGFSALVFSDFPGLQQLGIFSVVGLIASVLTTRFLLPFVLPSGFQMKPIALGAMLSEQVSRLPKLRLPVSLAVGALMLIALTTVKNPWADDLSQLSPISGAEQALDEQLRHQIGAPDVRYLVIAQTATLEDTLQLTERAVSTLELQREKGALQSFSSPTQFLPSQALQKKRQQALPAAEALKLSILQGAEQAGFDAATFKPFLEDVEKARAFPFITGASLQGTQLKAQVDSLLVERPQNVLAMMPLKGVSDEVSLRASLKSLGDPRLSIIDMKFETNSLYQAYRMQALGFAGLGTLAIAGLLWIVLRSLRRTLAILLPLTLAVVCTASLLLLAHVALSIFHIVAFLLVIGVGSNYALFYDQLAHDQSVGRPPFRAIILSLLVCNLSTVFGFGVLGFSRMPVLSAIGTTVAIGAVLSLFFSAVYLSVKQK
jgi:predicted exporter